MWRVGIAVVGAVVISALGAPGAATSEDDRGLTLTATAGEVGWISFAVSGPRRGVVRVHELGSTRALRLSLRNGAAARGRAVRWRCEVRSRRFVATLSGTPGERPATARITTPSCADRLRLIVVPARVRPGEAATVRVSDTWRFGDVSVRLCARPDGSDTRCERLRIKPGDTTARTTVRLNALGHRSVAVRSAFGRLEGHVEVRDDARLRVLVTGDSLILGLFDAMADALGDGGTVIGDPHPGRGITTPDGLDWPAHARRSARADRPDVTVVLLGFADAGYPLASPSGETVSCCDSAWVAAYAARVSAMMGSYLREGRGLVYWVLLPTPRSAAKARVSSAENAGVRLASRDHVDGVRVVTRIAAILSPGGRYANAIAIDGRMQVVRDADGVHLAPLGIRIATDVLRDTLLRDGVLPAAR
jgi:hypothetical protein